ncbi:MAG: hypothetical protein ACK49D_13360 [Flavobacteriia bacterium]
MKNSHDSFDKDHALHQLKNNLPALAPLKDFIHHNSLHTSQDRSYQQHGITHFSAFFSD